VFVIAGATLKRRKGLAWKSARGRRARQSGNGVFREVGNRSEAVLAKRFARYGLKINAEKTRMERFGRPPRGGAKAEDKPETFDFLGFTHYWGISRQGNPVVKKENAKGRFTRALRAIKEWGWKNRHMALKEQQSKLNELRWQVAKLWRKWLARRNRSKGPNWQQFVSMLQAFPLTPARVIHSRM